MENNITDPENQDAPDVKISIITNLTRPLSEKMLNKYAMLYMTGFNNPPWDIYDWKFTAERAREEFTRSVSIVLNSGGALIALLYKGRPAGFSIVSSLDIFVREPKKVGELKRLPKNYHNPGRYFERLSQLLKVPLGEFETTGYIADVVVEIKYRGKGYGRALVTSSLGYLKEQGKKCALAWTVNPAMANLMSQEGFKRISGIGDKGEGIDFSVQNGVWYPTLVLPAKRKTIQAATSVVAQHYLKIL